jgi:hypothetical protein
MHIGAQVEYDAESCAGVLADSETANESSASCNQQTVIQVLVFRIEGGRSRCRRLLHHRDASVNQDDEEMMIFF